MKHGPIYHFPLNENDLPINLSFIGVNYCHSNYRNVRKRSRITVIAFVLAGQGSVTFNSSTFHPKKGDVFILPEGHYHEVSADPKQTEQWEYIWFNITGALTMPLLDSYKLLDSVVICNTNEEASFQKAIQMAEMRTPQEMHNELPIIFHEIVMSLYNIKYGRNLPYSSRVQKIKNYLDNHIQEPFYSEDLSRHMGLSFKQINRLFKLELDTTVYNYILVKKIDSAKMMLGDTELNVSEIAYQLGYTDPQYFSNLFKKKVGLSPSSFRMRHS